MTTFDELYNLTEEDKKSLSQQPFWSIDHDDEKKLHKWICNMQYRIDQSQASYRRETKDNIAAYNGENAEWRRDNRQKDFDTFPDRSRRRKIRISINHLYDLIEQRVSRETKYRPAVNVIPTSNDHDDLMASKITEKLVTGVWDREQIDELFRIYVRAVGVSNEGYILPYWDAYSGPLHPEYVGEAAKAAGLPVTDPKKMSGADVRELMRKGEAPEFPLLDKGGQPITDRDGNKLTTGGDPIRIGEIKYKILMPYQMYLHPTTDYKECDWGFYEEIVPIENLMHDFPEKAHAIKETENLSAYYSNQERQESIAGATRVWHFWHRSTRYLEDGFYMVATPDVILESGRNPLLSGELPWVRRVDVPIPGQLNPTSALNYCRPLQAQINNLASMMVRNQALVAHPKWVAPLNSAKAESMGNDTGIIWYRGGVPPRLEQPNPMASSTFQLMETLEEKLEKIMGVFSISRGEAPSGVRAGVALQFLGEQENDRADASVAEHNRTIRELAERTLDFMAAYYDEDDGRIERTLGHENAYMAKYFKQSMLSRDYDIKVQTASALPQQKAQRIQAIFDIKERFPDKIDDDEALDQIGFGQNDKFITINTTNIRTAEAENDDLMRVGKTETPKAYEDLFTHYRIHMRKLNEKSMKDGTVPAGHVKALEEHIEATELLVYNTAVKNPVYLDMFKQAFPYFPVFFQPPEALMMMIQPPMPPEGQEAPGAPAEEGSMMPPPPVDGEQQVGMAQAMGEQPFPPRENQLP